MLVIVVVGLSLAMQSQQAGTSPRATRPITPRPPAPPRRPKERPKERKPQPEAEDLPRKDVDPAEAELLKQGDLLRPGRQAQAKVVSVVDERTIGPVTRSRLTLQVEPGDAEPFEVTTRVAFPTPASRAQIKVGGTLTVRYDEDDRSRVVVEIPPG